MLSFILHIWIGCSSWDVEFRRKGGKVRCHMPRTLALRTSRPLDSSLVPMVDVRISIKDPYIRRKNVKHTCGTTKTKDSRFRGQRVIHAYSYECDDALLFSVARPLFLRISATVTTVPMAATRRAGLMHQRNNLMRHTHLGLK